MGNYSCRRQMGSKSLENSAQNSDNVAEIKAGLCNADPITKQGKRIQMAQMLCIPLIPIVLLIIQTIISLANSVDSKASYQTASSSVASSISFYGMGNLVMSGETDGLQVHRFQLHASLDSSRRRVQRYRPSDVHHRKSTVDERPDRRSERLRAGFPLQHGLGDVRDAVWPQRCPTEDHGSTGLPELLWRNHGLPGRRDCSFPPDRQRDRHLATTFWRPDTCFWLDINTASSTSSVGATRS